MRTQTQIALAVGAGYLLGRRRKMRLAVALGTAAATGRIGGLAGQLLRRGGKLVGPDSPLGSVSPELGDITGMVRGELLNAGKAAALTAVRGRLERVSDRLHEQTEALRGPLGDGQRAGQQAEEAEAEDTGGEAQDYEDTEDYEDAEEYEDTEDYEDAEDQADDYEDEEADEGEPEEADDYTDSEEPPDRSGVNGETHRRRPAPPVRRTGR